MKKAFLTYVTWILTVIASNFLLTSCEAIGDIFSAGVYTGIFFVVAIIVVIVVIVVKVGKK